MPIPDNPQFAALLGSFQIGKPAAMSPDWREFTAIPAATLNSELGAIRAPACTFWYREDAGVGMESFLRKVASELASRGHPSDIGIAAVPAFLFALGRRPDHPAIADFNEILASIANADLTQYYLFTAPDGVATKSTVTGGSIGPFHIGAFDPEHLSYQSKKADSDFFDRYEDMLRKVPCAVERKHRQVKVIDWVALYGRFDWHRDKERARLLTLALDSYFSALSSHYFEGFFAEFDALQEVPIALGSGWIDLRVLRTLLGSQQISIYLNIAGEKRGFVSPAAKTVMEVNLGGAHLGVPATESFLQTNFQFESFDTTEIHQDLKNFCHFISLAMRHNLDGRHDEAFLHCVIALDLLLGDTAGLSASVASRAAVLVHRALGKDFSVLVKELQKIYGARSKYVHEGRSTDLTLFDSSLTIVREIAFCLLRLQARPESRKTGFHTQWMRDIDFVAAAIESGRAVPEQDLKAIGVAMDNDVRWLDLLRTLT